MSRRNNMSRSLTASLGLMDIRSHHLFAARDEQLPSQSGGTLRSVSKSPRHISQWTLWAKIERDQIAVTDNYSENVIKVMRDTAGELADHFHFLRFHDLRFQLLAFRPIFNFPQRTAHRRKQSREISLGDTVCRAAPERINGQLLVKRSGNEDKRYD
jgi:hypothetical protein